jgi:hypothetical protein
MVTVVEKAKEAARYDKPTERRLYPSRADANDFYDLDLHPFFAIDTDTTTSWGSELKTNEYVTSTDPRLKLTFSDVEGATQIRVRLQTIGVNTGKPKTIVLTALPGEQTMTHELKSTDEWQEIIFELINTKSDSKPASTSAPANNEIVVRALEIKIKDIHKEEVKDAPEDKKEDKEDEEDDDYEDYDDTEVQTYLGISEVELFVTGLTKENPALEKDKLENILNWKKARNAVVKIKGTPLPLAKEYKAYVLTDVLKDLWEKEDEEDEDEYNPMYDELIYEAAFTYLQKYAPSQAKDAIARANEALESEQDKWVPLNVASTAFKPYVVPPKITGVSYYFTDDPFSLSSGGSEFYLPEFEFGTLLLQDQLEFKDSKAFNRPDDCYDTDQIFFWRRAEANPTAPKELIFESCFSVEVRGGAQKARALQFLEYDDKGRLVLWVNPHTVQWFDWREVDGKSFLSGIVRLTPESIVRFIDSATTEPELSDDRPWLVLASSKPLFDSEGEKTSAALKDKLVAAGFTGAEIFDSRRAKSLSCCFTVVVAGRYKTKKEAQTASTDATKKGFESYVKKGW